MGKLTTSILEANKQESHTTMRHWFATVALLSMLVTSVHTAATPKPADGAASPQHQYANLYAFWDFRGATGFWNVDQHVRIGRKARYSYWAQNWTWTNADFGGYIGLQTDGVRFNNTTGDTAIFSLWNANGVAGPSCGKFSGEGEGYSCRLPFSIASDRLYRLRVWRLQADSYGQWWGGWVKDESTGREYFIGRIRVGRTYTRMAPPMNFGEYFGPRVSCDRVPVSIAYWTQPAANYRGGGVYQYGSRWSGSSHRGSCTGGRVVAQDFGWTRGVRMLLGGPR